MSLAVYLADTYAVTLLSYGLGGSIRALIGNATVVKERIS
jgi:hypothetical protein